jgi:hypothetical protein
MRTLLICLLLPLAALTAHGAPNTQLDATLEAANAHFQAKRPAQALPLLDRALAKTRGQPAYQARIEFFRARCFIELHRPDDARAALERYIAQSADPKDQARGRAYLARVQRRFYGTVRVACTNAALTVQLVGVTGSPQHCPAQWSTLRPKKYRLQIAGGKAPQAVSLEVVAGQATVHDLDRGTHTRTKLAEPNPTQWTWGAFGRAGLARGHGLLAEGVTLEPGPGFNLGAYGQALWPVAAVALGIRLELGYRGWFVSSTVDGLTDPVRTHGLWLPILAELELPAGFALELGAALELVLATESGDMPLSTRPGVQGVLGLRWALPWLSGAAASVRFNYGLVGALESVDLRRDDLLLGLEFAL